MMSEAAGRSVSMLTSVRAIFAELRGNLVALGVLSAVLNVLLLGGSIYMMMVYDSVLPSQSMPTLFGLLLMVFLVYLFQAAFEIIRARLLTEAAAGMTQRLAPRVRHAVGLLSRKGLTVSGADSLAPMRDLDTLRQYLSGPGPAAFMDLPWVLFFLAVLSLLHPYLGLTGLAGAAVMLFLTYTSDRASEAPTKIITDVAGKRFAMAEVARRHASALHALGMTGRWHGRWALFDNDLASAQDRLGSTTALIGGSSRVFRLFIQSLVLTVGALLVISGKASAGVIFAASILAARALAPIDTVIAHWKSFAAARGAQERLHATLAAIPEPGDRAVRLDPPQRELEVENLTLVPPGGQQAVVHGVSFRLVAGNMLGVIGVSAAGKSSLLAALVGAWDPARGEVRLDGAQLGQWEADVLGASIGYLPQTIELLPGTIAENIARFADEPDSPAVIAAAKAAGIHAMVVALPDGYETRIAGEAGALSAGQRQRVALARALYGDPFLVVLDEPNSNLDAAGEIALDKALQAARDRGAIVILVAHRRSAVKDASHILVMAEGRAERFGPRDEILTSVSTPPATPIRVGARVSQVQTATTA